MNYMDTEEFLSFCHSVFDDIPVPIDFLDKDGRMLYINKAFSDFLEIPEEEMEGKIVTDINPTSLFIKTLQDRKSDIAIKHRFPNGKEAVVHRIAIMDKSNKLIGGFGMILFDNMAKMQEILNKCRTLDKELRLYKNKVQSFNRSKYTLDDIRGKSQAIINCKKAAQKIARVNYNVMITGESGVGKELFVQAIHNESLRRDKSFVSLNCSAIPENLIEAELFGYETGAFTGAKKGGDIGKFELADGGTLFLDEIGDMNLNIQAKLLRVLQEKEIVRVGGKNTIPVDVRVICATNRDIEQMVKDNLFRQDLYYRLNVLSMEIPPLRERKEDIPILADKFLEDFFIETGDKKKMEDNVKDILMNHDWKGNIRELKNTIDKMCVNAEDTYISIKDIPSYIINSSVIKHEKDGQNGLNELISSIEKDIIINTLKECRYNKSMTAEKLKIPRVTLYRKLKDYDFDNI